MPEGDLVTSTVNAVARRMRKLATRKARDDEGAFVVEGIRGVRDALEAGWRVDRVVLAPELITSSGAVDAVAEYERAGGRVTRVGRNVFESFSRRENPTGIAAVVEMRQATLTDLEVREDSLFIVLHDVSGPGNLGTIVRTADAASASVVVVGETTDVFHPQAVKASMGALFGVPLARAPDLDGFFGWAAEGEVTVAATSGRRGVEHWSYDYPRPLALLLGSEAHGLDDETIDRTAAALRIPMAGRSSSLNLAAAAAVLVYEAVARHAGRPAFR